MRAAGRRLPAEDGTLVAPGRLLPTAERFGLIGEIDQWVARQGIGHAARGHPVERNLSAQSLGHPGLLNAIRAELRRTGADPGLLAHRPQAPADHRPRDRRRVRPRPHRERRQPGGRARGRLATMDLLRQLGVDCAQGFAIARPAPVADVLRSA